MTFVTQQPPAESRSPPRRRSPHELDAAAEEHEAEASTQERRYPSTIGGAFYLLILGVGAGGIAIAWHGDWRLGIRCLAGGLCFAALLRLVLPARDAGMLAVRNRFFDVILLGGLGAAIFFLASTIPNQPG